ncbi:MAG: ATP-binding protein [Thermodesulfovibrionales bacterium]|nr:ATP-binding protein [Thermodesulfovibrionales bacterium]
MGIDKRGIKRDKIVPKRIREMNKTKEKIYVSKKILADIGRGIYRTPANALKELVSNAFDACATWVKITTNAPYFDVFTCEDNGEGLASGELRQILQRIGSSVKRTGKGKGEFIDCKVAKRPVIGKIGIGLLAVCTLPQN